MTRSGNRTWTASTPTSRACHQCRRRPGTHPGPRSGTPGPGRGAARQPRGPASTGARCGSRSRSRPSSVRASACAARCSRAVRGRRASSLARGTVRRSEQRYTVLGSGADWPSRTTRPLSRTRSTICTLIIRGSPVVPAGAAPVPELVVGPRVADEDRAEQDAGRPFQRVVAVGAHGYVLQHADRFAPGQASHGVRDGDHLAVPRYVWLRRRVIRSGRPVRRGQPPDQQVVLVPDERIPPAADVVVDQLDGTPRQEQARPARVDRDPPGAHLASQAVGVARTPRPARVDAQHRVVRPRQRVRRQQVAQRQGVREDAFGASDVVRRPAGEQDGVPGDSGGDRRADRQALHLDDVADPGVQVDQQAVHVPGGRRRRRRRGVHGPVGGELGQDGVGAGDLPRPAAPDQERPQRRRGRSQARRLQALVRVGRLLAQALVAERGHHGVERGHVRRAPRVVNDNVKDALRGAELAGMGERGDERRHDGAVAQAVVRRRVRVQRPNGVDVRAAAGRGDQARQDGVVDRDAVVLHGAEHVHGLRQAVVLGQRRQDRRVQRARAANAQQADERVGGDRLPNQATTAVRRQHRREHDVGVGARLLLLDAGAEQVLGGGDRVAGGERGDQGGPDEVVAQHRTVARVPVQVGDGGGIAGAAARGDEQAEHGGVDVDAPVPHGAERVERLTGAVGPGERGQDERPDVDRRRQAVPVHGVQRVQDGVEAPVQQERLEQVGEQRLVAVRAGVADHQVEQALGAVGGLLARRLRLGAARRQDGGELLRHGDVVVDGVTDQEQGRPRAPGDAAQVRHAEDGVVRPQAALPVPLDDLFDDGRRPRRLAARRRRRLQERAEQGVVDGDAPVQACVEDVGRLVRQVPLAERHHGVEERGRPPVAGVVDAPEDGPASRRVVQLLQGAARQRRRWALHEDVVGVDGRPTLAGIVARRPRGNSGRTGPRRDEGHLQARSSDDASYARTHAPITGDSNRATVEVVVVVAGAYYAWCVDRSAQ